VTSDLDTTAPTDIWVSATISGVCSVVDQLRIWSSSNSGQPNRQNYTGNGTDVVYFRNIRIRNTEYSTYTESYVKTAHSEFYAGLKTDGLWDKLTEFYLLVGKTFGGITIKGKGSGTLTNNNFVSGDLLAVGTGAGLTGNAYNKIIQTNYSISGNPSLSAYVTKEGNDASSGQAKILLNAGGGGRGGITIDDRFSGNSVDTKYTVRGIQVNSSFSNGFLVGTNSKVFNNSIEVGVGNGNTLNNVNVILFGTTNPTKPFLNTSETLTFAHIGTGLTDTDAANLSLRVNKLMYDLGCNVYNDINTLGDYDEDAQAYFANVFNAGGNFE
jgi:hypothetical protein